MNRYYDNATWTANQHGPVNSQFTGSHQRPLQSAAPAKPQTKLPLILFIATVFSTIWAGCLQQGINIFTQPWLFYRGLPFSLTLLLILGVHEAGHYIMCRVHGIPATVPYFIPMPNFLGTMGAFIKIKAAITNRRALLDVGMSGPLLGFAVALPATIIGYMMTGDPIPITGGDHLILGKSILTWLIEAAVMPGVPEGMSIPWHPVAFAGYIGLFVTAMNLLPIGQLDGGHVISAMFGAKQWQIARYALIGLGIFGIIWTGWWFWALMLLFFGTKHPVIQGDARSLDPKRRVLAWATVVIFFLTFVPVPFAFVSFY